MRQRIQIIVISLWNATQQREPSSAWLKASGLLWSFQNAANGRSLPGFPEQSKKWQLILR